VNSFIRARHRPDHTTCSATPPPASRSAKRRRSCAPTADRRHQRAAGAPAHGRRLAHLEADLVSNIQLTSHRAAPTIGTVTDTIPARRLTH
jgi:hypothetical protein